MKPIELEDKIFDFMHTIDGIAENQDTLELMRMTDHEFNLYVKTTLATGINMTVSELEKYMNHKDHQKFCEFTITFMTEFFCDLVMAKHG